MGTQRALMRNNSNLYTGQRFFNQQWLLCFVGILSYKMDANSRCSSIFARAVAGQQYASDYTASQEPSFLRANLYNSDGGRSCVGRVVSDRAKPIARWPPDLHHDGLLFIGWGSKTYQDDGTVKIPYWMVMVTFS